MRTVPAALQTHLNTGSTELANLWAITRQDGNAYFFTDHDQDISYGGDVYKAAIGYKRSSISTQSTLAVDDSENEGIIDDDSITEEELRAGLWDGADIILFAIRWSNPALGDIEFKRGTLGEVVFRDNGLFYTEIRGITQALQVQQGEYYTATCRAQLGDRRCKIPLRPNERLNSTAYAVGVFMRVNESGGAIVYTSDEGSAIWECTTAGTSAGSDPGGWAAGLPGDTVTDGTVVWTKRTAWTRAAQIDTVTSATVLVLKNYDIDTYADGWFEGGVMVWETGLNAGTIREVIEWDQASRTITLLGPPPYVSAVDDRVRVQPGCDRVNTTCRNKFDNWLNFRGEPQIGGLPGMILNT
jgi:hypothetical protein